MKQIYKYTILLLLFCFNAKGNNLQVSDVQFADQNVGTGEVSIQFNISWDNSWRVSTTDPYNWDAVWLFVKYKSVDGKWYHATLSQNNNSTGSQGSGAILSVRSDNVGAYFHRSGDGTGTFSSTDVKLRWDYEANGISCNLGKFITEVKVFAIEMVYIPQGAFYVGDGASWGRFHQGNTPSNPFQITNEATIRLGNDNTSSLWSSGSWDNPVNGTMLPAAFPKGYKAYYCMKYEITQEQYAEFLNTLTPTQKNARYSNYFNQYRYFIKVLNGIYGCDANNNNILNEANDGQNIACNYLRWTDGVAYLDWAGLRPMTELEYEKSCRGTITPVANEYAWGNVSIVKATGIINNNSELETCTPNNANCSYDGGLSGPVRVGNFARVGGTRTSSGATYYGILDMSGNLWERVISAGNSAGRNYTGILGDGTLSNDGFANQSNWGALDAAGSGFRGSNWYQYVYVSDAWRVSDRISAASSTNATQNGYGFRGVGSAENSAVNMCGQIWSKKNLNVITYRNGDTIPQVSNPSEWCNLTTGAWCYYDNNPANGEVYGKMYNWYAVTDPRGLAPEGWHIPTDQEFKTFELCLGMTQSESDAVGRARGTIEGGKIKSLGTIEDGNGLWNAPNTGATNEYDFSVIPGGYRNYEGAYVSVGLTAHFWTNTPANANQAYHRSLINNGSGIFRFIQNKYYGFYVRCIRD